MHFPLLPTFVRPCETPSAGPVSRCNARSFRRSLREAPSAGPFAGPCETPFEESCSACCFSKKETYLCRPFENLSMQDSLYILNFSGWKIGTHELEFQLDKTFFADFPDSEIQESKLNVTGTLDKKQNMLILDLQVEGEVILPCDRCAEDTWIHVENVDHLLVKFGDKTNTDEDDVWTLGPSEYQLDIKRRMFEMALLALPSRRIHSKEADCNPVVLGALNTYRVEENADSIWKDLKDFDTDEFDPSDEEE